MHRKNTNPRPPGWALHVDAGSERGVSKRAGAGLDAGAIWVGAALGMVALMGVLRFVALTKSPPGFFFDEAGGSLNALCIARTGADQSGARWPLFFPQFGGWVPPTYIYFNAVWSMVFGGSIAAFRASSAFFGTLTVAGVYMLARLFVSRPGALLALLSASISPTIFSFSRIAWECAMMPTYLVWGLYFFFRSDRKMDVCISALLLGLCCYAYLAGRVVVPLLLPMALWVRQVRHPASSKSVGVFLGVFIVTCLPLAYFSVFGGLMARAQGVGLLSDDVLQPYDGPRPLVALSFFVQGLLQHFSPQFLFLNGDDNRRHGLGTIGQLSWLDALGLMLGLAMYLGQLAFGRPALVSQSPDAASERRWLRFLLVGVIVGVVPAALTKGPLPHAIRCSAEWPIYSLLVGCLFGRLSDCGRHVIKPAVITAALFLAYFLPTYFYRYPVAANDWFDGTLVAKFNRAVEANDSASIRAAVRSYASFPLRYHLVANHHMSCQGSRGFLSRQGH